MNIREDGPGDNEVHPKYRIIRTKALEKTEVKCFCADNM